MSVITPIRNKVSPKVQNSEYIKTENQPDQPDTKPAEPEAPAEKPTTE